MSIQSIIDGIIVKEGGYVDHPNDRGGKTNWGITEKVARAAGYHGEMQDLPRERAVEIYMRDFIVAIGIDRVNIISPVIAEKMANISVNQGQSLPGQWLQRTLNLYNLNGKIYPDLVVDGAIGAKTLNALAALRKYRGADAADSAVFKALNGLQAMRYFTLAESDPTQRAFMFGWFSGRIS